MTDPNVSAASEAERQILDMLWKHGPGTVREVQKWLEEGGTNWQRSTVLTLLQRLEKKGLVRSDRQNPTFVFHAAVSHDELTQLRVKELAEEFPDARPASLFLAFAERMKFSQAELTELRGLIDGLIQKDKRSRQEGGRLKRRGGKS